MTQERIPDLASASSPPRRELKYDDFENTKIIGTGGNAIVKRVSLSHEQRPHCVALKEPQSRTETLDVEVLETFFNEAQTWKRVDTLERTRPIWTDSEHIVGIVDIGEELPWIAMEYMDGGNLEDRLKAASEGLPIDEVLWFGERLCRGLKVAHDNGIAHLDLKPANILFQTTAKKTWDIPKIADWGLARILVEQEGSMDALSVSYAAPEQFDVSRFGVPDTYTDVYQLGAIIYAMLTSEPPYTGSQTSVMYDITGEKAPVPPSEHRRGVPQGLDDIVLTALEREKTNRYADISQFLERLHELRTNNIIGSQEGKTAGSVSATDTKSRIVSPKDAVQDGATDQQNVNEVEASNSASGEENPNQPSTGWFDPYKYPEAQFSHLSTALQAQMAPAKAESLSEALMNERPDTLADTIADIYHTPSQSP